MIQFTVPDFYEKRQFNLDWIGFMKHYSEKFEDCVISSVYGSFPLMIWAGGRQNKVDNINFVGIDDVRQIVKGFNSCGVGVVVTCTNSMIEVKHLGDCYCNSVMEVLEECDLNAVLVNSLKLNDYLQDMYPKLKRIRSTTTCSIDLTDTEYYERIVVDYRLNNKAELLVETSEEQRKRIEIMLNDTCPPYCPYRGAHYQYISHYNLQGGLSRINPQQPWECHQPEFKTSFYENLKNPATVSAKQMHVYHNQGFNHFKIVGREFNPIQLAEIYTYYMVKPEFQAEVMSWAIYRFSNLK